MKSTEGSAVSQAVGLICKLVGVQFRRQDGFNVMRDEPIEAPHDGGSDCDRPVVVVAIIATGMVAMALRHVGTAARLKEVLKMLVKTSVGSSKHSLRTQPRIRLS